MFRLPILRGKAGTITDYLFFLSYNREEWDEPELLRTFHTDLCLALRTTTAWPRDRLGFLDVDAVPLAAEWPDVLAQGLGTCRVFVPLYHARYFSKTACGQEWMAFRRRQLAFVNEHRGQALPARIVPVLWGPPASFQKDAPSVASRIQFTFDAMGQEYAKHGLAHLLRPPEQSELVKQAIQAIAGLIAEAARPEAPVLPPLPANLSFQDLASAWAVPDGSVRVADGWRIEKLCDRGEQADVFVDRFPATLTQAPGAPQAYLVTGERTELPESLVERLVDVELQRKLADLHSAGRWLPETTTAVARAVDWPRGRELADLQRRLLSRLLDSFHGAATERRPTAGDLLGLPELRRSPLVAIRHSAWLGDKKTVSAALDLVRWYVDEFWAAVPSAAGGPQILLFISLITDPAEPALGRQVQNGLARLVKGGSQPTRVVLPPLGPVTDADLREWFAKYTDVVALEREERISAILALGRNRKSRSVSMEITEAQLTAMIEGKGAWGPLKVRTAA